MVGFPYDDLERWRGIYPADVYENEYGQLVEGWRDGLADLLLYKGQNEELDEMILMARALLCQFESAYHHVCFVSRRDGILAGGDTALDGTDLLQTENSGALHEELLHIIRAEMETVQTLIDLRLQDSRIGYESSNHYFYTLQDLKEKMINLVYCERFLTMCNADET